MIEERLNGITQLVDRWSNGEPRALDELVTLVYNELAHKAHQLMLGERSGHVLQTSALVHEAYLRLIELNKINWQGRSHFFSVAAGVMRRVLVDQARTQQALKRGGNLQRVTLSNCSLAESGQQTSVDILALNDALKKLSMRDNLQTQIVELRYFAGLTVDDTAATLGISSATVRRKWLLAKSQLYRMLN